MTRVHLVLGATGSIGAAVARRLHHAGHTVFLAGRNPQTLAALATELGAPSMVVEATDAAAVDAAVNATVEHGGRIDGAFNGVGSLLLKAAHHTRDEEFAAVMATHVNSSFFLLRACVRRMEAGGSIVLVSSAAARIGLANHEAIAAAKGAVEGLALSAAATYAARGIRINVVAPGLVRSGITERIFSSEAALKGSVAMHPLGRAGEPDDVARAAVFFLDGDNSWITGQVLGVDGGLADLKTRA
jgi:3-oxoacyl-[acyl-carrier protein] reductase